MIIGKCPVCGEDMRVGSDMTNADRIRSMTDEELAEWMCTEYRKIPWCRSDNEEDIESGKCRPQVCIICANVWLKEEVGDVT